MKGAADAGAWPRESLPPDTGGDDRPTAGSLDARAATGYLDLLSQTATEFVTLSADQDVYRHVAMRLHGMVGDAVVAVAAYDSRRGELCQRALVGAHPFIQAATEMAGTRLQGCRGKMNDEARREILAGRLLRVEEGLYEALFRTVPRVIARAIERIGDIREVYGMGCVANGDCVGSIMILLRTRGRMPPVAVVEAFVHQSALAMQRHRAETVLRSAEERYRTLMEKAADACLVLSADRTILEVNEYACQALGRPRADLVGRRVADFLDRDDVAVKVATPKEAGGRHTFAGTRRMRRADGSLILWEANVAPLPDGELLVTARDITERRRLEKELLEISERERQTVGRNLHDSLGQLLAGTSCLCTALEKRLASVPAPSAAADAARISELVREAVALTRRIAQGLCPVDIASEDLAASLDGLAARTRDLFGVRCDVARSAKSVVPHDTAVSHLYLMAQEAVTNAVRHGGARSVAIGLSASNGCGLLSVRDDGCGMAAQREGHGGLGLQIMRYRAELIDGALEVHSDAGGTIVQCAFPLKPADA